MPNWDETRGRPRPFRDSPQQSGPFRNEDEREAWRHEMRGHRPERRPFDEADRGRGGYEDRQRRDAGSAGYRSGPRGRDDDTRRYGEPTRPGGQVYGVESSRDHRDGFAFDPSAARSPSFDHDDPGVGQGGAGYGRQARSNEDHENDPDYLHWREAQMRSHDRDYAEWRRHQHAQYDEQYRQFRSERREHFGRTFHDWRSQASPTGGAPDTGVAPGVGDYGDRAALPGGGAQSFGSPQPSGRLERPSAISGDPALSQTGGHVAGMGQPQAQTATGGPEFGKEPPQVQASADGDVRRETDKDHAAKDSLGKDRKDDARH